MNVIKKLTLPAIIATAGVIGVGGASLVSSLTANADTSSGTSITGSTDATTSGDTGTTSSGTTSTDTNATTASSASPSAAPDPSKGGHSANGMTETLLTGDELTSATKAAEAAEPGATVVRAETDAEGAKYEVHMKKSDGSMVTVKLDASFNVTSTENGM